MQRVVVVRKPALVVALVEAGRAAVALAAGILGRDPDHLTIVGGSAVELIGIAVGIAAVDIGEHVRLEPSCSVSPWPRSQWAPASLEPVSVLPSIAVEQAVTRYPAWC